MNNAATHRRYPWYDSWWLTKYARAREIISAVQPSALADFDAAFKALHAPATFETRCFDRVLDADRFNELRDTVARLKRTELELHEASGFGRFVVHDHPFCSRLQQELVPLVAEAVGEPVEPRYNFLSLYTSRGVCPVHLDAPHAKWTLDLCIAQTAPWPIYFSQVVPWPQILTPWETENWEDEIRQSPALTFKRYELQPEQAIIFSGSSQWHYRERFPEATGQCQLLFLHYIPAGTAPLLDSATWPALFGIPELSELS